MTLAELRAAMVAIRDVEQAMQDMPDTVTAPEPRPKPRPAAE